MRVGNGFLSRLWLTTLLAKMLVFGLVQPAVAGSAVAFVALGDIPYLVKQKDGRTDDDVLKDDIAPLIRQRQDIPFVIHYGDIGREKDACADVWLERTRQFWATELVKPVFYTPGDNEWADCDREKVPHPTEKLERLEAVRKTLVQREKTILPEWRHESQPGQVENETWWRQGVRYATVHVVGSHNGRSPVRIGDPARAVASADARDAFNRLWLTRVFRQAKEADTQALVLAFQFDPFEPKQPDGAATLANCLADPDYHDFCRHLQSLAGLLDKPVLLVHGDSSAICLDQPFPQDEAPKVWRLNGPGDFKEIDAALVSIDAENSAAPFAVQGLLSGQAYPAVCDYRR